jgi:hypothetical protein
MSISKKLFILLNGVEEEILERGSAPLFTYLPIDTGEVSQLCQP